MTSQKEIPIFFTIDNSYAPFLAAALNSAIKNCSPERQYRAIILHQELNEENIEKLSKLSAENFAIEFVEMKDGFESITDRMSNRLRCDYSPSQFISVCSLPQCFPNMTRQFILTATLLF